MSRVGLQPIEIPPGVKVELTTVEGSPQITVQGPRGTLRRTLHPDLQIERENGRLWVKRPSDSRFHKALHGLSRTLIANMVVGVTQGFRRVLEINGVGYRAEQQGKDIRLNLGFSHPVLIQAEEGLVLKVEEPTRIAVEGIDKEVVGNMAAKIRAVKPSEPYKLKGLKYREEQPRRKAGKQSKKGAG
jgi:large subunit ribosomal protein L6